MPEQDDISSIDGFGFAEDLHPGLELRKILQNLYPADIDIESSFVSSIDSGLKAEGSFYKIVYDSTINYLVRRFINTAEFMRRKYEGDDFPEGTFVEKLREFIEQETDIRRSDVEKLIAILQMCISIKRQSRKSQKKRYIRQHYAGRDEIRCYICGRSLILEDIQIEHEWPKTMGGPSKSWNLKVACSSCNDEKQNYIDGSDFHYEQICLSTNESEESFSQEFKRIYKIAIWAKNSYRCNLCGQPTELVGRLNFARKNLNDSWHFLNIDTICENCNRLGE